MKILNWQYLLYIIILIFLKLYLFSYSDLDSADNVKLKFHCKICSIALSHWLKECSKLTIANRYILKVKPISILYCVFRWKYYESSIGNRKDSVCLQLYDQVSRQPKRCRSAMLDPKGRAFCFILGSLQNSE